MWRGGTQGEPELLARCYRNTLGLAQEHGLRSIAFPAISCGVFGYPAAEAARVALHELSQHLDADAHLRQVFLVAFEPAMVEAYRSELARASG